MCKEKDYKDAGLRQSTADQRSWINDKGDKVTNVGKDHAIVNGSHKYGESAISNAVKNLNNKK